MSSPHSEAKSQEAEGRWSRRFWLLTAAAFGVRVLYLSIVRLELVPDEAYYWDWSRQLDWGYFSKPPMVAWLIAGSVSFWGATEFGVRFPAAVLVTLGMIPIFQLTRNLFGSRAGYVATVAGCLTPGSAVLGLIMTIDAPFLCAWTWSLYSLWQMLDSRTSARWNWTCIAVLASAAGLLSKQSMLLIFPLIWLAYFTSSVSPLRQRSTVSHDDSAFISFAPWNSVRAHLMVWTIGSLACLTPVIWWNMQHDWVMVDHTQSHFEKGHATYVARWASVGEFIACQLGCLSPWLGIAVILVGAIAARQFRHHHDGVRFLLWTGMLPMIGVGFLSFVQKVQPNWPAALLPSILVLFSGWATGAVSLGRKFDANRAHHRPAILVAGLFTAAVLSVPFWLPESSLAGTRFDPTLRLRGWKAIASQLERVLHDTEENEMGLEFDSSKSSLIIAATSRGPVSELAFYLPTQPRVYRFNNSGDIDSQHDLWDGPPVDHSRSAILLAPEGSLFPPALNHAFHDVAEGPMLSIPLGPTRKLGFRSWVCTGIAEWPSREEVARIARENTTPHGLELNSPRPRISHREADSHR